MQSRRAAAGTMTIAIAEDAVSLRAMYGSLTRFYRYRPKTLVAIDASTAQQWESGGSDRRS